MGKRVLCVGLVCLDIVSTVNGYLVEDTDQRISQLDYRRGGNASNSSSVLAELGAECEFLGTLAESMELPFIRQDFIDHGVFIANCPTLPHCQFPTSIVIINSDNGSRTILHHPKNLPELSIEQFNEIQLENYRWIHFEGRSSNVSNIKQMIEVIRKRQPNAIISLEIEKTRSVLAELFPLADIVFVSKEFALYSGYSSMENAVEGFVKFIQPKAVVVCAWGEKGAAALKNEENSQIYRQNSYPPMRIIDTLGAGDAFNAAFIYSHLNNSSNIAHNLEFACRVAGCKIGQNGFKGIQKKLLQDTLPSKQTN